MIEGCSLVGPEVETDLPAPLARLEAEARASQLIWADDDELIYGSNDGIYAIDIGTGSVETLVSSDEIPLIGTGPPRRNLVRVAVQPASGSLIYYLLDERGADDRYQPRGGLYRLERGASPQKLLSNVSDFVLSDSPFLMAVVFSTMGNDSTYLYQPDTQSLTFVAAGEPVTFLPDGSGLLYDPPKNGLELMRYTLADQNHEPLYFRAQCTGTSRNASFRWIGAVLYVIYGIHEGCPDAEKDAVFLWDSHSLMHREIWEVPPPESIALEEMPKLLSPDGRQAAVWTLECIATIFPCGRDQYFLWYIDLETGAAVNPYRSDAGFPESAYSSDGRRLAFTLGADQTTVYISETSVDE